jgi:hypothetical protein
MHRFNINLPEELYQNLRMTAFHAGISISKVIVGKLTSKPLPITKMAIPKFIKDEPLIPEPQQTFYKKAGEIKSDDYI